ncbi:hypothetical protein [Caballeronia sp. 15711]|uniref:hypothetical protein n=1 Tax=Caballeronia sp. 15711 TaxID=3391029 RepID=UPI0039E655FC
MIYTDSDTPSPSCLTRARVRTRPSRAAYLAHTGYIAASVTAMVVCGADYQQFLVTARTAATARTGAFLAAIVVSAIGFLPAVVVLTTEPVWHIEALADPVQTVPIVLMHSFSHFSTGLTRDIITITLLTTALGSGCSILRAMSDAIATLGPRFFSKWLWLRILPIFLASAVSMHGQSLVDMMVDLDMVYLAAVSPLLGLGLLRVPVSDKAANASIVAGCCIAVTCYLMRWMGLVAIPEATSLFISPPICLTVMLASLMRTTFSTYKQNEPPSHR